MNFYLEAEEYSQAELAVLLVAFLQVALHVQYPPVLYIHRLLLSCPALNLHNTVTYGTVESSVVATFSLSGC